MKKTKQIISEEVIKKYGKTRVNHMNETNA